MKHLLLALALVLVASGLRAETPQVNVPFELWCKNYKGGSCVHASAVMLWRWQGQYQWANYWKAKYAYGEGYSGLHEKCENEGVDYCDTYGEKDVTFIEWSLRTRRGCLVGISNGPLYGYRERKIAHAVCVVHMDEKVVGILDNNDTGPGPAVVKYVPRRAFLQDWFAFGSWAWTPVSTPPAPPQLRP